MGKRIGARLGMATTGELLAELQARLEEPGVSQEDQRAVTEGLVLVIRLQERLTVAQLEYKTSDA